MVTQASKPSSSRFFKTPLHATMAESNCTLSGISHSASWVAYFRVRETQRPEALFSDPYAERLAGEHSHDLAT